MHRNAPGKETIMRRIPILALAAAGFAVTLHAPPALAQHRDDHWHDNDIHHFNDHDYGVWRGGRWFHGPYGGRTGWWWIVGGVYYFYPAPIYPYPDPYVPPAVAPNPTYWFYCGNPQGYYPYVPQCSVPWQQVPPQ
jgi:hypothetical protein